MPAEVVTVAHPRTAFGHPRGLAVLFLTQMWEQFSFYGMRALLIYYMIKELAFNGQTASLVFGIYGGLAYLTPLVGAQISDRWLGPRRSVIIGACIMALGHFMMASELLLYPALATIAIGNGFFLPSLPSQVRGLYAADDTRRGFAYNVYYVGLNLGAFIAPLVCGTLGEVYGWHWGFAAAGVGMLFGLAIYLAGMRDLPSDPPPILSTPRAPSARKRADVLLLAAVATMVVIFRAAYAQTGNAVAVFMDSGVDRSFFGTQIPMTWFQSLNPLFVFLLSPFVIATWTRRAALGAVGSSAGRMALGAAIVGSSFVLLALIAALGGGARVSWVAIVAFFLVLTWGELFILPVGLGLFARAAPDRAQATTVALWFFAAFGGNLLGGLLGSFYRSWGAVTFFAAMAATCAVAFLGLLLLSRPVARLEGYAAPADRRKNRALASAAGSGYG